MEAVAYLDTHVAVWLYAGLVERVSPAAAQLIESAELRISPMVTLELALLREVGRITPRAQTIVADLGQRLGLVVCDAPFAAVAEAATHLTWTRDPFDRVIVAQASLTGSRLITKDQGVHSRYQHCIW